MKDAEHPPAIRSELHQALIQHGIGNLQEAADVGAVHQIAGRAVFSAVSKQFL
jgi:hypothetical protein